MRTVRAKRVTSLGRIALASISRAAPGFITVALAILIWQAISLFFFPIFSPRPGALVERMVAIYSKSASYDVVAETLSRIFEGFAISMFVGMALGVLMGLRRGIEIFFDSWIMVLLTFPAVCWAFLSVLWLGVSDAGPILTTYVLAWITIFVILMLFFERGILARLESRAFAWRAPHAR